MCQEQMILDLLVESSISGERNSRSANFSLVETGGREKHRWSEERVVLGGLIFMRL